MNILIYVMHKCQTNESVVVHIINNIGFQTGTVLEISYKSKH